MSTTRKGANQAPPRTDLDEYGTHAALVEAVSRYGARGATERLRRIGALVGEAGFQRDAELANTHPPVLATHDRWGGRIDEVRFHPAYHRILGEALRQGAHASCWTDPGPGAHAARAAAFLLLAQVEPGHACPVSMTHAVVPALRTTPAIADEWLPKVTATEYDPELRDPAIKTSATFGMAMTEKQGGSDVRANTTRAVRRADGSYRLTGHKWFCSAPQSDAFLVLAQTPDGLSSFLVPRVLPGGDRNGIRIERLKDKLGNRSNASAEIELEDCGGRLLGEEGRGVRTILAMVEQTRLDCVLGSAAGMRQAVAEAAWHVRHRSAFGGLLIDQPAMTAVIADLQLETEAAVWTGMRLAAAYDGDDPEAVAFRRLATAVGKYRVCQRGPGHAAEAMECLGGNGYTEAFPLARRYREQPVMAIWEGSGSVIALDVLRTLVREPAAFDAFDRELQLARGTDQAYDRHLGRTRELVDAARRDPDGAPRTARRLVEALGLALQASILLREAPAAVADAFVAARLGEERGSGYGALPAGIDVAAVAARA
ncbi:acyl-CoA dehydrogenase family protein [Amnibacterium sp.]|uniref:acyl-CoA dehydrogenase family protein n=1 Tax=Amnibacterium sp. TaxID=1872496 RepID=UPI002636DB1A|nr:acyl-CoA dehydrogenase family protein [Amnibacterium sp.]MCU1474487.1 putative acyl-CoA dehydrogenase [Amnibacterium sp.]